MCWTILVNLALDSLRFQKTKKENRDPMGEILVGEILVGKVPVDHHPTGEDRVDHHPMVAVQVGHHNHA